MRILVTGVTGFIGYSLAEKLVELGHMVYGLVRFVSTTRKLPEGVEAVSGDLLDYHSIVKIVEDVRPEAVFHLGALTPVSESFRMPVAYMETNLIGTIHLCEALRKHAYESLRLFALAGTTEMFDTSGKISPETPLSPTSPYAVSKIGAYYYLYYMWKTFGFPVVIAIPTNTYGRAIVGQRHFVIEKIITHMLLGKPTIYMGNPDAERDFMFRDDHVEAYIKILEAAIDKGRDDVIGNSFSFGTGVAYSIREVFELCKDLIGWEGKVVWGVFRRPNEPKRIVVNPEKAKRVLGWTPRYDLESGLKKAIEEWRVALGLA